MKSPPVHPLGSRPVWLSGALVQVVKGERILQLVVPLRRSTMISAVKGSV